MAVDFRAIQAEFAGYIRDPGCQPAPAAIDPARMALYRELFFNNIDSFISSNFPVLRTLHDDAAWLRLIEEFYARHSCRTPFFCEIAEEFLTFLQQRAPADGWPFLLELAHYEWVEMALSIADETAECGDDRFVEQVGGQALALSPLAWPLVYQYPVDRIAPGYLPERPPAQPTYLVVYRDAADQVRFFQSTPVTNRLLEIVEENPGVSGDACAARVLAELGAGENRALADQALSMLRELAAKGIIIPAPVRQGCG